ncbi:MAG: F0F1 ATP synthase subunit A [Oscillospiraceae bacterium]|nr:F0F1 ATP synthase subunit A [Oscillospiraceae bacterium]
MGDFKVVGPKIYFRIPFINWAISETTVNLLIATIIIVAVVVFLTRKLSVRKPGTRQILAEAYVNIVYSMVNSTMGKKGEKFAPYFGSLFLFSLISSLLSLIGRRPPTADINVTAAWATISFVMIQYNGIKAQGIKNKIKGLFEPIPLLFPINFIGEFSTPLSLALRHYANLLSGVIISSLLYTALGAITSGLGTYFPAIFQIGLPAILSIYFDLFTAVLQAFIFCMLTMASIAIATE